MPFMSELEGADNAQNFLSNNGRLIDVRLPATGYRALPFWCCGSHRHF